MADKETLSEQEIRDRYITLAIGAAGCDLESQAGDELAFANMQQVSAAGTLIPGS